MPDFAGWIRGAATWLDGTGIGSVFGFAASILGCLGVAVAVRQAWRARSAAEAAQKAAEDAAKRIYTVDVLHRLAVTLERLGAYREALVSGELRVLSRFGSGLRVDLIEIAERAEFFPERDRQVLQDAVVALREAERMLNEQDPESGAVAGLCARLTERSDELHAVLARLRVRVGSSNEP
jgi:hypothetical protein